MANDDAAFDDFLDTLKVLVRRPSVVGAEQAFFRVLRRELEEVGARVTQYLGLLVAEGAEPDAAYVSAHIDRHGLVCTGPGEFQYAAFVAQHRGDLLGDSVSEKTYRTIGGRFAGQKVIAYEPWSGAYLGQGTIASAAVSETRANLVFEIEGLDHVLPGTPVGYQDRLRVEGGSLVAQLDNVLTTAILVHAFHRGFRGTALFSAQEEAGRSWRFLHEWFAGRGRATSDLLVLDTSPFPSLDEAAEQQIVLRHEDANATFDPAATERVLAVCRRLGVRHAYKNERIRTANERRKAEGLAPLSLGSTELGRVAAASGGAINGTTLQVPTTGYHTAEETASIDAVRAALAVVGTLLALD